MSNSNSTIGYNEVLNQNDLIYNYEFYSQLNIKRIQFRLYPKLRKEIFDYYFDQIKHINNFVSLKLLIEYAIMYTSKKVYKHKEIKYYLVHEYQSYLDFVSELNRIEKLNPSTYTCLALLLLNYIKLQYVSILNEPQFISIQIEELNSIINNTIDFTQIINILNFLYPIQ